MDQYHCKAGLLSWYMFQQPNTLHGVSTAGRNSCDARRKPPLGASIAALSRYKFTSQVYVFFFVANGGFFVESFSKLVRDLLHLVPITRNVLGWGIYPPFLCFALKNSTHCKLFPLVLHCELCAIVKRRMTFVRGRWMTVCRRCEQQCDL